jgi:hypothetical protein
MKRGSKPAERGWYFGAERLQMGAWTYLNHLLYWSRRSKQR